MSESESPVLSSATRREPVTTFLFRIQAQLGGIDPLVVKDGPYGTRVVAAVASGTVTGPRVSGQMVPGLSADWVTVRQDRTWVVDVRAAFITDDGAPIIYTYTGLSTPLGGGRRVIKGVPRFETGDERYGWLNTVQGLLIGETDPGALTVHYDIYSLE